ncbi:hypothetical protein [Compostimonas suwonensis]|uniref:Uncharacterized protein n=1 Tax=Compostimonas suwonensis TaxID=1048394 RepID=A0A2M9BBQ8_9MICO|nr:hypothetical protein [Compostimonas suwonensis]PJJ55390.1 hypothetical protein CLV54_3284 [Compostimonas suwonensis]
MAEPQPPRWINKWFRRGAFAIIGGAALGIIGSLGGAATGWLIVPQFALIALGVVFIVIAIIRPPRD